MKTAQIAAVGLVLLVLVLGAWWQAGQAAAPEQFPVRAWVLVDFRDDPRASMAQLWSVARPTVPERERWAQERRVEERPQRSAALRISLIRPMFHASRWEALVLLGGPNEKEVLAAARYLERYYTHVEIFAVEGEIQ
jgi:hypothetical protein